MAISTVSASELSRIVHVDAGLVGNRVLPCLTFYTPEDGWEIWIQNGDRLQRLKGTPAEAYYFARAPEAPSDLCLYFLDFIGKQVLRPDLVPYWHALTQDLHFASASLAKFDLFAELKRLDPKRDTFRFAETELEYLLIVCRSMFDLFAKLLAIAWRTVRLFKAPKSPTPALPESFAKLVLSGRQHPRPAAEIADRYGLPEPIANACAAASAFFMALRKIRDLIVHHGHSPGLIFTTEKGFAVNADLEPFASFGVWDKRTFLPNRLASLRPVLAYIVWSTFTAFDQMTSGLASAIDFGPDAYGGLSLFVRGSHTQVLLSYARVRADEPWWPL